MKKSTKTEANASEKEQTQPASCSTLEGYWVWDSMVGYPEGVSVGQCGGLNNIVGTQTATVLQRRMLSSDLKDVENS